MQLAFGISVDKNGRKPDNTSGKHMFCFGKVLSLISDRYTPIVKHPSWTLASDLHGLPLDTRLPLKESTITQLLLIQRVPGCSQGERMHHSSFQMVKVVFGLIYSVDLIDHICR
jgi:hypothetical protein